MVIYFINVPLIEMAAREKRGKSAYWKWLHVIDAHHRGEEEIPLEIKRRRVIWVDQRHSRRLFYIQWNMFRDPEMPYFSHLPKMSHSWEPVHSGSRLTLLACPKIRDVFGGSLNCVWYVFFFKDLCILIILLPKKRRKKRETINNADAIRKETISL